MANFTDNFNRIDGAIGNGWEAIITAGWSAPTGTVTTNQMVLTGAANPHGFTQPGTAVDGHVVLDLPTTAVGVQQFLILRRQADGACYAAYASNSGASNGVYKVSAAGAFTSAGTAISHSWIDGDQVKFEASGSTFTLSRIRAGVTTVLQTVTDATISAAGRHGFASDAASQTMDNYVFTDTTAAAPTTDIICGTDSRERGTDPAGQTPTQSTPHQLALLQNANSVSFDGTFIIPNDAAKTVTVRNKGVNGRTLANFVLNNMASELTSTATVKMFVNESGINDLGLGGTAATLIQKFADVQAHCNANTITHYPTTIDKIALGTLNTDAALVASTNAKVDVVNADLVATYPTKVVEFNRNTTLIDITNTEVSPDGAHSAAIVKPIKARMIDDRIKNIVAFPVFTTATIPNVVQNTAYNTQLVVTNSPTAFTILSGAPAGMVISNLGVLSGNVTGAIATYSPVIRAPKANGDFTDKTYTMNVTAPPANTAPTANAGTDQTIALPANANLSGTAADDGFAASVLTTTWSKFSGVGVVTFGNAAALITTAAFSVAGVYVLRLTASDGTLSGTDDVTITVNAAGSDVTPPSGNVTAPTANQTISGIFNFTGNAADNVAVASVQLLIDGIANQAADAVAPYSFAVNTASLSNGAHTAALVISDTATPANTFTTPNVNFTVSNVAVPPATARLAWLASTDNVTVPGNIVYLLKHSLVSGAAAQAATAIVLAPGVRLYDVPNVSQGVTVYFQTAARDEAGNISAYSSIFSQTY